MATTAEIAVVAGDVIEVSGRRVGDPGRLGEIVEVLGEPGHPHYLVRWADDHLSVLYPGEGTTIRSRPKPRGRRRKHRLAAGTEALVELLRGASVEFEVLPHRRTLTATSEARALGVLPQVVAKTLVVRDPEGRAIRAVVPASGRLDLRRLGDVLGVHDVELLSEVDLVSAYPQFELGAVPPFGGPSGDRVLVDRRLAEFDHVVVEAGVHDASLRLRPDDLLRVADAELADIATE